MAYLLISTLFEVCACLLSRLLLFLSNPLEICPFLFSFSSLLAVLFSLPVVISLFLLNSLYIFTLMFISLSMTSSRLFAHGSILMFISWLSLSWLFCIPPFSISCSKFWDIFPISMFGHFLSLKFPAMLCSLLSVLSMLLSCAEP